MIRMKIVVSSDGDSVESKIDQRFGRCEYFIVADIDGKEVKEIKAVKNEGAIQGHGAGIKAAQQIADLKAEAVITGNLGPNATAVLDKICIKAYHASGMVKEGIDKFIDNKLDEIKEIAEPHSGIKRKTKGERIFFPLLDNKGLDSEISQHFGHAPFFGVYDVQDKKLEVIENKLDHTDPNKSPIDQIEEAVNPTTIYAKGIGGRAISIIAEKGLMLKTGSFNTVKEAVENLDRLEDQTQSCGHEH
jgi:predicted Fe-Mo cluster-binding NifX family protein